MSPNQRAVWEFYGFKSVDEGCPVQRWYDGLGMDAQDEITNLVDVILIRSKARVAFQNCGRLTFGLQKEITLIAFMVGSVIQ